MSENKFTWVKTHKELVDIIRQNRNQQNQLIQALKKVGITGLHDENDEGERFELKEIDPFSFFCFIFKYGSEKRLKFLQDVAVIFNATVPEDDYGIPSVNAQKVCLFPFQSGRKNDEINRLWDIFESALNNTITDEQFEDVLNIKSTGPTKLTEGLFNVNPDSFFPINGPTRPYLKEVFGIDPKFNTFSEYSEIINQIKQKTELPFYELSHEAWKWNDQRKKVNYWIFQGNPKVFDFETALKENILTDWTVSAHKDKIKPGDKVILWITGNRSGCYALAEVTSEPHEKMHSPDDHLWKKENKSELKADIRITHNLVENPLLKDELADIEVLSELKVGNQGTNFMATQEEFEKILEMTENKTTKKYWLYAPGDNASKWEVFYSLGIMGLGWDEIGDLAQYKSKEEIYTALFNAYGGKGSKKNDVSANFDFYNNVKIGDIIIVKKGRTELLGYGQVNSDYLYDQTRDAFKHTRKVIWELKGIWEVDFSLVVKTLTDITRYRSDLPEYETYYEELMGIMTDQLKHDHKPTTFPLNTILYGPPGTGKTYYTVLKAAQIIENRLIDSYGEALKVFKSKLHDQIEFITFHQNYSYEDFIQGLRPDTENEGQLSFEKKDGIFKIMADRALKNILSANNATVYQKDFEEVFDEFIKPLREQEEEIEVKMIKSSFYITGITKKSIEFRKNTGESSHSLSIATLKQMYDDRNNHIIIGGLQPYYNPLLKKLLELGKVENEPVKIKNYVIILDEINRANISRVFGELITLIEPDKRSHGAIPMEARLPSGDIFIVPSNLYIIGTMNTADKSIALLDIALRRRFEFEAMYPKYEIEGQDIYDAEILRKINEKIISSKGHDFQIGHAYFMGENRNLVPRMNKKVIPLLLEYYMNDAKEVKGILQSAGLIIEEGSWPIQITGKHA